jgi:outer membrane protein OmpA-like peptidoglycan-associated protein
LNVDGIQIRVADPGAKDLGKALSADCHVALIGLLFDFNKATLQAASEPVLQQVLALLKKDTSLKVEVQGHTDNVGTDAYNQTLSEARATAVVAWLTQHGEGDTGHGLAEQHHLGGFRPV